MTRYRRQRRTRLLGLLAERAVFGLDPAEDKACAELALMFPEVDLECMDQLAAAVVLGGMGDRSESLPARLRSTIRAMALEYMKQPIRGGSVRRPHGTKPAASNNPFSSQHRSGMGKTDHE